MHQNDNLFISIQGYSKLGGSAEYSLLLEQVRNRHNEPDIASRIYSYRSINNVIKQVMEGNSVEGEENPYFSPANRENELYVQLRNQGIKMIRSRDIE